MLAVHANTGVWGALLMPMCSERGEGQRSGGGMGLRVWVDKGGRGYNKGGMGCLQPPAPAAPPAPKPAAQLQNRWYNSETCAVMSSRWSGVWLECLVPCVLVGARTHRCVGGPFSLTVASSAQVRPLPQPDHH